MKTHENYRVHCRLKELMRLHTVDELHRTARVSRDTISQLRNNTFKGVSRRAIARICGALGIGVGDLFELVPEDIWLPIRLAKEVTIHVGSRALAEPKAARADCGPPMSRQFLGSWDLRAYTLIQEYLVRLNLDVHVCLKEHVTGAGRGTDPAVRASARDVFERGNHVVIGSPIANQFTEEVVCHAYDVPPYNPQMRDAFPYGFVWDEWRKVPSSFGWPGRTDDFGIAARASHKIVAPHVIVSSGEGTDGALILVQRVFQAPSQREVGDDDERVVIGLLGYSGAGTYGAARLATDPNYAAGLYPAERGAPRMRAVRVKYFREASALADDNRVVTAAQLVPEGKTPGTEPPAMRAGGKTRPGR